MEWKKLDLLDTAIASSGAMGCIALGRMKIDAGVPVTEGMGSDVRVQICHPEETYRMPAARPPPLDSSQLVFCRDLTHVLTS
jgi:hypothetical protein